MKNKIPKDFYESELHEGDRVAFNWCGAVRQGIIESIKHRPAKETKYYGWDSRIKPAGWTFKIKHLFNGGISTVKNIDGISKIKIDLE